MSQNESRNPMLESEWVVIDETIERAAQEAEEQDDCVMIGAYRLSRDPARRAARREQSDAMYQFEALAKNALELHDQLERVREDLGKARTELVAARSAVPYVCDPSEVDTIWEQLETVGAVSQSFPEFLGELLENEGDEPIWEAFAAEFNLFDFTDIDDCVSSWESFKDYDFDVVEFFLNCRQREVEEAVMNEVEQWACNEPGAWLAALAAAAVS